jgi:rod shape determining protein RodA
MPINDPSLKWQGSTLIEWPLAGIALLLAGIGIVLIYSATLPLGDPGRSFVLRQVTWCSLGIVLMALCLLFDYHLLDRWAFWLYGLVILSLVAVWALGKVTAGSRRWIELGLLRFQPSEFAKLAVIVILAKYYQHRPDSGGLDLSSLIRPALLVAIPVILVLLQPDLGTAGVIVLIAVSMTLFAGIRLRLLAWTGGIILAAIPILWFGGDRLLMGYQKQRLITFLHPDQDPLGAGYHIIQSQIAIGSGGIFGQGFLQGTQNQLMFLPVKHTDFIFSILAEEWGFVGCAAVFLLFAGILLFGLSIAGRARDDFGTFLAFGCTASFFWHFFINVGMTMGLLPVVGVPFTFLSYGGSSLLASFLSISILLNVSMRRFSY